MLVGKRGGPIIRRTSSMSGGMNIEIPDIETQEEASDPITTMPHHHQELRSMVSPRNSINNSMDTTPHFLRTCRLCNRRLAPGRDIYMYRGDTAFCSLECREEQMKQDERKDKWKNNNKVAAKKQQDPPPTSSTKTQTLAAA